MRTTVRPAPWSSNLHEPLGVTAKAAPDPSEPFSEPAYEENDPRWQLAQRIIASKSFAKSGLLCRFLLYVCDRTLNGRTEEISEQQIGVHVFGRKPQYNPAEDNIVRNYARQLRQRLDTYFEEEGKTEELRLRIPRGNYVPIFTQREEDVPALSPEQEPLLIPVSAPVVTAGELNEGKAASSPQKLRAYLWGCGLLLTFATAALVWMVLPHVTHAEPDPSRVLWSQIFNSHQTFLVPADDGLVMYQNLTGHSVHLAEYISKSYLSVPGRLPIDAKNMADLGAQRYTSVADLDAVLKFSHLSADRSDHVIVRYAGELHMDDLKDSNAVLLGSSYSNPWVELFQKNLNFEFTYEPRPNRSYITNKHPLTGEPSVYTNDADAPSHQTYAVVALAPNLNNTGWVLMVEGLTMAGTQAAVETIFNHRTMQPILEKAKNSSGTLRPFEVLIETRSFGSTPPQSNVIASRFY